MRFSYLRVAISTSHHGFAKIEISIFAFSVAGSQLRRFVFEDCTFVFPGEGVSLAADTNSARLFFVSEGPYVHVKVADLNIVRSL